MDGLNGGELLTYLVVLLLLSPRSILAMAGSPPAPPPPPPGVSPPPPPPSKEEDASNAAAAEGRVVEEKDPAKSPAAPPPPTLSPAVEEVRETTEAELGASDLEAAASRSFICLKRQKKQIVENTAFENLSKCFVLFFNTNENSICSTRDYETTITSPFT